jgi:hypothetical protein
MARWRDISQPSVAAIYEYVPSKTLAVFLQVVMLAAVVGIFLWLR